MCASCRHQHSRCKASVLASASSAKLPAPRSSCCEQLSCPRCQRVPSLLMLALACSSAFLSDGASGIPTCPRAAHISCPPGCSGSPSGHSCARIAGLSTADGGQRCSSLLRRPCCQRLGRHVASSCHVLIASVQASACWRSIAARPFSVTQPGVLLRFPRTAILFPAGQVTVVAQQWASVCASGRSQYSWWRASVLVSASSAMLSAHRPSDYEQLSYPRCKRAPGRRMLALAASPTFLGDATCGTPVSPTMNGKPFSCQPGCSGSPNVGIHVRVVQVSVQLVAGVCPRFCFVGHAASSLAVMLRPAATPALSACPGLLRVALARGSAFLRNAACGVPSSS